MNICFKCGRDNSELGRLGGPLECSECNQIFCCGWRMVFHIEEAHPGLWVAALTLKGEGKSIPHYIGKTKRDQKSEEP